MPCEGTGRQERLRLCQVRRSYSESNGHEEPGENRLRSSHCLEIGCPKNRTEPIQAANIRRELVLNLYVKSGELWVNELHPESC